MHHMYTDPVRQYNRTTVTKLTVVDRDKTRQQLTTLSPSKTNLEELRQTIFNPTNGIKI